MEFEIKFQSFKNGKLLKVRSGVLFSKRSTDIILGFLSSKFMVE